MPRSPSASSSWPRQESCYFLRSLEGFLKVSSGRTLVSSTYLVQRITKQNETHHDPLISVYHNNNNKRWQTCFDPVRTVTDVKTMPCVRPPPKDRTTAIVPETLLVSPVSFKHRITVKPREKLSRHGFVPIKEPVCGPRPCGSATVQRNTTDR